MEHLWSLAVAISGSRWQIEPSQNPQNQAKTVAVGCKLVTAGVKW